MTKIILLISMLFVFFTTSSQTTNIIKLSVTPNTIGFDIGGINERNNYTEIDFAYGLYKNSPSYMNFGVGHIFKSNIFFIGLLGIYSPNRYDQLRVNIGCELGTKINKKIVGSVFCTNNTYGLKIGLIFKND